MARLIDADKIYDAIERRYQVSSGIEHRCERDFLDLICESDTVDAVEVVRCRDCKYWKPSGNKAGNSVSDMEYIGGCKFTNYCRRERDFCSYGERKDGDKNA